MEPQLQKRLEPGEKINASLYRTVTLTLTCNNCGTTWEETLGPLAYLKFLIFGTKCPNCHKKNYKYEAVGTLLSAIIGLSLVTLGLGCC